LSEGTDHVSTTAGALAVTWKNIAQKPAWREKAQLLAAQTMAKMDEDHFIEGEAARYHNVKYGIDIGYQVDIYYYTLVKGKEKVNAEYAIVCLTYNLRRAINILGIKSLIMLIQQQNLLYLHHQQPSCPTFLCDSGFHGLKIAFANGPMVRLGEKIRA
jgi:hypothetical protein